MGGCELPLGLWLALPAFESLSSLSTHRCHCTEPTNVHYSAQLDEPLQGLGFSASRKHTHTHTHTHKDDHLSKRLTKGFRILLLCLKPLQPWTSVQLRTCLCPKGSSEFQKKLMTGDYSWWRCDHTDKDSMHAACTSCLATGCYGRRSTASAMRRNLE